MDGDDSLIKNTYLNLSKPAAFSGASKIHQTLKQLGHNKPGIHKIKKWLQLLLTKINFTTGAIF